MGEARVVATCFHELLAEVREALADLVGERKQGHEKADSGSPSSRRMRGRNIGGRGRAGGAGGRYV